MADGMEVNIQGLDGLLDRMGKLPNKVQRSSARKAARQGMAIVRDAARQNVKPMDDPGSPEQIWKNIAIQESGRRSRRVGGVVMRVGVRGGARGYAAASGEFEGKGKGNPGGDTFYWRFLEFGTQHIPATPFLRPALATNIQKVIDRMAVVFNDEIIRQEIK